MKKMVLIMMTILLSSSLYGKSVYDEKYQMHSNVFLENFDISSAKRTEVFFGTKDDYVSSLNERLSAFAKSGVNGISSGISSQAGALAKGLTSGLGSAIGTGLGIGLIIEGIRYYKEQSLKPVEYYYVVDFINDKQESTRGIVTFISYEKEYKETDENENQIKEIMRKGF
jgi:hypothetical protein